MSKSTIGLLVLGVLILTAFITKEYINISSSLLKVEVLPLSVPSQRHESLALPIKIRNESVFSIKNVIVSCQTQPQVRVEDRHSPDNSEFAEMQEMQLQKTIPAEGEALLNCTVDSREISDESETKQVILFVHIGYNPLLSWQGKVKTYKFTGTVTNQRWQWSLSPFAIKSAA